MSLATPTGHFCTRRSPRRQSEPLSVASGPLNAHRFLGGGREEKSARGEANSCPMTSSTTWLRRRSYTSAAIKLARRVYDGQTVEVRRTADGRSMTACRRTSIRCVWGRHNVVFTPTDIQIHTSAHRQRTESSSQRTILSVQQSVMHALHCNNNNNINQSINQSVNF